MSTTNVRFTWNSSPNVTGTAVTDYKISFQKKDSSFVLDTTQYNGVDSTIATNRQCDVPMSVFTTTCNLVQNDVINGEN